jgi:hypothetical protein
VQIHMLRKTPLWDATVGLGGNGHHSHGSHKEIYGTGGSGFGRKQTSPERAGSAIATQLRSLRGKHLGATDNAD